MSFLLRFGVALTAIRDSDTNRSVNPVTFCMSLRVPSFAFQCLLLLVVWGLVLSSVSHATERPKVGVVLSGGGMNGFAHVGALKVIEEAGIPIDFIAGTSMGAIVGALYATGHSVDDLETLSTGNDWSRVFTDYQDRRELSLDQRAIRERYIVSLPIVGKSIGLPRGVVSGQRFSSLFNRLTLPYHDVHDFRDLPVPFVCVATDIETGGLVVLDKGFLPDALRATMAIPSVFTPVEIDGRLLVDGMLVRNLPVQEVRELGADLVISVDVGAPLAKKDQLGSFVTIAAQAMGFMGAASTRQQRGISDVLILPDLKGASALNFSHVAEAMLAGESAARDQLPALLELRNTVGEVESSRRLAAARDISNLEYGEVEVHSIEVVGLENIDEQVVLGELALDDQSTVNLLDLERAVRRVYNTGFFERVSYQIRSVAERKTLSLRVVEKEDDAVRFGLRYDSQDELAAVFNLLLRNPTAKNSVLSLDLVTGRRNHVVGRYLFRPAIKRPIAIANRVAYVDDFVDLYDGQTRIAELSYESYLGEVLFEGSPFPEFALGVGLRGERVRISPTIGALDFINVEEDVFTLVADLRYDTQDRASFPTRGSTLYGRANVAEDGIFNNGSFGRYFGHIRTAVPAPLGATIVAEVAAGTTTGNSDLPAHYRFILGGIDTPALFLERDDSRTSFLGLRSQELIGRHAQFAQLGLQWSATDRLLFLFRGNVGNTFEEWNRTMALDQFETGAGATIGWLTPIGPFSFTGMYGSSDSYRSYFSFGHAF